MNQIKYKLMSKNKRWMSQKNVGDLRTWETHLYASFDFRIMSLHRRYADFLRTRRILKNTIKGI